MKNRHKVFYGISLFFLIVFIIAIIKDYINIESFITVSLEFAIKLDILIFLVPSIVFFIIAFIVKKKNK